MVKVCARAGCPRRGRPLWPSHEACPSCGGVLVPERQDGEEGPASPQTPLSHGSGTQRSGPGR